MAFKKEQYTLLLRVLTICHLYLPPHSSNCNVRMVKNVNDFLKSGAFIIKWQIDVFGAWVGASDFLIFTGNCYEYAFAGGCSSNKEKHPRWKYSKRSSLNDCKAYCEGEPECRYFEYEPSTTQCRLHKSDITKGNNYPSVKCYRSLPLC